MKMTGNTILITGGGSGIGRGLAEAFHKLDNTVIIAGRRQSALDDTTNASPGMKSTVLDIENATAIRQFAAKMAKEYPALNVVIHSAGIMRPENLLEPPDELTDVEATITTNLLGPIRLTAALLPQLKKQPAATVMTVTSGLAYLPMALTPTYCATKAAMHSYSLTLRYQLRETNVEVLELVPPYVQTELMGSRQASDPRAMPLKDFIDETMKILREQPEAKEILVERVHPLRFAERSGKFDEAFRQFNDAMMAPH
ncbi:MAG TPA: SDR family oxidoreductase [Acidobacteriaceae bacterium]